VVVGQFSGFRSLWTLDGEQRTWAATEESRRTQIGNLEKETDTVQAELTAKTKRLAETRAEITSVQTELDRVNSDLAQSQKELQLARTATAEAERAKQLAIQQAQEVSDAKSAVESRILDLTKQHEKLKSDIATLQAELPQLTKDVDDGRATLTKLNMDIVGARKQVVDGQKQVDSIQQELRDLQDKFIKESQSLETAFTENGKVRRKREDMLGEVSTAERRLAGIKKEEETLTTSNSELQKANLQLAADKADSVKSAAELQTRLNDLQKQLETKTGELDSILKRIDQAIVEEKRLQAAIKMLSEKLPPPKETESSESKKENKPSPDSSSADGNSSK